MAGLAQEIRLVGGEAIQRVLDGLGRAADDFFKKLKDGSKGAETGDVQKAVENLKKSLENLTPATEKAFKDFGVNVKDARGNVQGFDSVLSQVAQKFQGITDPTQRAATAVQLFGEAGRALVPFLEQGSAGVTALQSVLQQAASTGTSTAQSLAAFGPAVAVAGGAAAAAVVAVRALSSALEEMALNAAKAGKAIADSAEKVGLSVDEYQKLAQQQIKAGGSVSELDSALEKLKGALETKALEDFREEQDKLGESAKKAANAFDPFATGVNVVKRGLDGAGNSAQIFGGAITDIHKGVGKAATITEQAGVNVIRFGDSVSATAKKIKEAKEKTSEFEGALKNLSEAAKLPDLKLENFEDAADGLRKIEEALRRITDTDLRDKLAKDLGIPLDRVKKTAEELALSAGEASRQLTKLQTEIAGRLTTAQNGYTEAVKATQTQFGLAFGEIFIQRIQRLAAEVDAQRPAIIAAAQQIAQGLEEALKAVDEGDITGFFSGLGKAAAGAFRLALAEAKPYFDFESDFQRGLAEFQGFGRNVAKGFKEIFGRDLLTDQDILAWFPTDQRIIEIATNLGRAFRDAFVKAAQGAAEEVAKDLFPKGTEADIKADVAAEGWRQLGDAIGSAFEKLRDFLSAQQGLDFSKLTDADFTAVEQKFEQLKQKASELGAQAGQEFGQRFVEAYGQSANVEDVRGQGPLDKLTAEIDDLAADVRDNVAEINQHLEKIGSGTGIQPLKDFLAETGALLDGTGSKAEQTAMRLGELGTAATQSGQAFDSAFDSLTDADFASPTKSIADFVAQAREANAVAAQTTSAWTAVAEALIAAFRAIGSLQTAQPPAAPGTGAGGIRGEIEMIPPAVEAAKIALAGLGPAAQESATQLGAISEASGRAQERMTSLVPQIQQVKDAFDSFSTLTDTDFVDVGDDVQELGQVATAAQTTAQTVVQAFTQMRDNILAVFGELPAAIQGALSGIEGVVAQMVSKISSQMDELMRKIQEVAQAASSAQSTGGGGGGEGGEGFARGGYVSGPGTSRSDSIRAWLSNGEFVINAAATKRFLPLLRAINGMRIPRSAFRFGVPKFADGGLVGSLAGLGSGMGGTPVNLHIAGMSAPVLVHAGESALSQLNREAKRQQLTRLGRKPSWVGG